MQYGELLCSHQFRDRAAFSIIIREAQDRLILIRPWFDMIAANVVIHFLNLFM